MSRVIFDIETLGKDFDSFEGDVQEYLLKWAETEEEKQEVRDSLALYPHTAEIISLGMFNPDTGKGMVFYQSPDDPQLPFEEEGIQYKISDEKGLLENFWETVCKYDEFVTFNGRSFDCPFIITRSAVHKIRPRRDLMPYRFNGPHIDLLDQLSFFGASRKKFNLDMWCRTFGIHSPKCEGIKGDDVRRLYAEKKYLEIARYCGRDIKATAELFRFWESYFRAQSQR